MKYKEHGLGAHPIKPDERDYPVAALLAEHPSAIAKTYRYWYEGGPMILNQGSEGTCEGHAWTSYLIDGPITHPHFPSFDSSADAHEYARKLYLDASGDSSYQQGTFTRSVLDTLLARQLIDSYHRCATVDEVVQALLYVGPVGHASAIYWNMEEPVSQFGNSYMKVDPSSGLAGYHEYLLTGVNVKPSQGPPFVRMQNSWGSGWGHGGTARISIEDLNVLFMGDAFTLLEKTF